MDFHFSDRPRYGNLHLSTALEDWDMAEELQQCTTTDQNYMGADEKGDRYSLRRQQSVEVSPCKSEEGSPERTFRPTLWLVVDPNIVIPCPEVRLPREPHPTPSYKSVSPDTKTRSRADCSTVEESDDEALTSSSEPVIRLLDNIPRIDVAALKQIEQYLLLRSHLLLPVTSSATANTGPHAESWWHWKEDDRCSASSSQCTLLRSVSSQVLKAPCKTWPRPPINYCTLISLALWNSEDGSLNVQQIYSFVREHFPFFRVAPDGWKNTVRHNLCFSSSFEKSSEWACADGQRRSCLWKLTRQGRRKFNAEMKILTDDLLHVLRRSMNKPALMELMFGM